MSNENLLVLSIVVQAASLIALLSLGLVLTRYFKAQAVELAGAREALEAWFGFQTRLHREAKAKETLVPDALAWVALQLKAETEPLAGLKSTRAVAGLQAVELLASDGRRVVVTPHTAQALRAAQKAESGRLAQALADPLLNGSKVLSIERSLMNAGDYFDLEAAQAGQLLGVEGWDGARRLWFHVLSAKA